MRRMAFSTLFVTVALATLGLVGCKKTQSQSESATPATAEQAVATTPTPAPEPAAKSPEPATPTPAAESAPATAKVVELTTSMGKITIELEPEKAPKTVANFAQYVRDHFYDGTIFHRVIDRFMIQGGGFDSTLTQKPTRAPVINEADNGSKNLRGTLAMARTPDPNSATAQFFINLKDNDFLNFRDKSMQGWGYCVFGRVTGGMDVVDRIAKVKTGPRGPHQDVPVENVTIESARIVR